MARERSESMRKILILLLAAVWTTVCGASAESAEGYLGEMTVVNCEEWVSLRAWASTSADRLAMIPLDATVEKCAWFTPEFIRCEYEGLVGYVLADYLADVAPEDNLQLSGHFVSSETVGGYTVVASRDYAMDGEVMYLVCVDGQGEMVWTRTLRCGFATELTGTEAFLGGTAERPLMLAYNAGEGLYALDFFTGEEQWLVPKDAVDLGGSLSHAVAEDGTVYIGGYYGPDPVAISVDGELLWQSASTHDAYWMYDIAIEEDCIIAAYTCIDEHEASGRIGYGFDGVECWVEWD